MKSGSNLERVLTAGHFAVTGELGPPKNGDPEVVRKKARLLKGHVDAVNITDCQTAIVRMSSIGAGLLVLAEGVEPVIQMTCRDRNRIGMQSDILGAGALGLKNLLCLTGDHQKFGNHPGAKGVFDMDSIQMLGMVKGMRDQKIFQCGEALKGSEPRLFLGAAANPFAGPPEFRAARMGKKVQNGADFIQTQIVYNVEKFARFMEMARDLGLHEKAYILAGVTPPKSLGMARYMKKFVPGMDVPDEVIKRMQDATDKEDEGINICVDIINQVRQIKGVAGVHVMAIEWESAVPEIVKRAKLSERPKFAETMAESEAPLAPAVIEVRGAAGQEDKILAAAKAEAEQIVAAARETAAAMTRAATTISADDTTVVPGAAQAGAGTLETEELGEEEMNEKERLMALAQVKMGLDSLRKAFGLSDDQMEALTKFAGAEAILSRLPEKTGTAPAIESVKPATPPASTDNDAAALKAKAEAEVKARTEAEAKAKAEAEAAAKVSAEAEGKAKAEAAAKVKAAEEAKAKAEAEAKAKAEAEAKAKAESAAQAQAAAEAKVKAAAAATVPAAAPVDLGVAALALEKAPLASRAGKLPADSFTVKYTGAIREVILGNDTNTVTVGGAATMPFHLFEGAMPRKPLIAMEVLDSEPTEWPDSLKRHFGSVLHNPLDWARKCVNDYRAEAICLSLVSTDPNGANKPAAAAAKIAAEVIQHIDVPIIVWGCGNAEKDTESLREITSLIDNKKVCLAPLSDANYRSLGASAMAFKHPMVAASPIDVNLAKQLNILLENLGVSLNSVLIDPSIGALGYGIEYTYSVMERIRLAALTQQDEKLQVPFICNLGREVWKAKECRLPSDHLLGDQERRGVMMEAITATCMLMAGGEVLIMRHPQAISLVNALIPGLMG